MRGDYDCGIAALATLFSVPYEDVYAAAYTTFGVWPKKGLWLTEVSRVAQALGHPPARRKRKPDLELDTGILHVERTKGIGGNQHLVVLRHGGIVIDPDGGVVDDIDDYLEHWRAKVKSLLIWTL